MGLGNDSDKDDKDNDNEISSNQLFTVMTILIISSLNEMTMTTKYFGQSLTVMGPS